MQALRKIDIHVNAKKAFQKLDGFGVNINSKYWKNGELAPVVDLLIDDLGATLFRVDIYGKSDWVDPESRKDAAVLNPKTYAEVYRSKVFRDGWGMMRHLNRRGLQPYLTASGDVPRWMLGKDGKTLADYDSFCEMMVSLVAWARRKEQIDFRLFGPLNETDIGSPEGPSVGPRDYVKVAELLHARLDRAGLTSVKLVLPEQARLSQDYVAGIVKSRKLRQRVAVLATHTYGRGPQTELTQKELRAYMALVDASPYRQCRRWMTEYGELEQSGEREWYVAWVCTQRLFGLLEAGYEAALYWDAYDNHHDHNDVWTNYGLIRYGRDTWTPKKRYYAAKQVYRFARPGMKRVEVRSEQGLRVLGFASPSRRDFTVVGMNETGRAIHVNTLLEGLAPQAAARRIAYHCTSEIEDCYRHPDLLVQPKQWPFQGAAAVVPAESIFTLTTLA